MELMRFNDFAFPYNPSRLEVGYEKALTVTAMPFSSPLSIELGLRPRVVRGQGEWAYPQAMEGACRRLREEFLKTGPGRLLCPVTEPMNAYFTALRLVGQGGGGVVSYSFEFVEDLSGGMTGAVRSSGAFLQPQALEREAALCWM